MRTRITALIALSSLGVTLASCSVNPAAAVCNSIGLQSVTVPQLTYPVPGYNQVPDASTFIVVAYPAAPSLAQTITITPAHGSAIALGPLGAVPPTIPRPHAKVLPGQGPEYGVSLPKLSAKMLYTVNYRYATTADFCGQSTTSNILMGTFTTQ